MTQTDTVRFLLPKSRTYQFPAMAVVQSFVNGFQRKAHVNWLSASKPPEFALQYSLENMAPEDWKFWQDQQIQLATLPEPGSAPDAEIDLTESKAHELVKTSARKHIFQLFGSMCGIAASEFPAIRKVEFSKKGPWKTVGRPEEPPFDGAAITDQDLEQLKDEQVFGIVGKAGWQTYLAAAYMLPVIELIEPTIQRDLFSKWKNPYYRVVTSVDQIPSVMKSLKERLGA